jgi:hypothetical protein
MMNFRRPAIRAGRNLFTTAGAILRRSEPIT